MPSGSDKNDRNTVQNNVTTLYENEEIYNLSQRHRRYRFFIYLCDD